MGPLDESEPTPEELREAAALASALDTASGVAPPEDVAAAAALLRFAQAGGLSTERREVIWGRIGASGRMPWARWVRRVGAFAAAAAVAAVVVLVWRRPQTPFPPPDAALLLAQSRAASNDRAAAVALDEQMRGYRGRMLASLEERYRR